MLGEGAAGAIEGSGTTFLCVQPRKEPSVGPAMGRTHLSGLPRSPLEAAPSSPLQQPLPVSLLSRSVGAQDRESLANFSGQRKGAKRLQNNPQVLGQESKTKHKSSTSSVSYSEASKCPSQISQPGLCHPLSPKNGPCQGGSWSDGGRWGSTASALSSWPEGDSVLPLGKYSRDAIPPRMNQAGWRGACLHPWQKR